MSDIVRALGFLSPDWRDLVEILVVAWLFYRILLVLAGTRAIQMLLGLLLLVTVYAGAQLLGLTLLTYLMAGLFEYGIIAALVVFQPELRSALAHLGQNRLLRPFTRLEQTEVAEEITLAVEELARNKVGAIIALEREIGLGEYAATGTPLQARVSAALMQNIFTPYSVLHDGAAILRGDEIVAAGAILPLTQFPVSDRSLGTRHRAALGLSEETDAVVIVVSEETGRVSVAHRGQMQRDFGPEALSEMLSGRAPLPGGR